jgi:4-carboxymuconolactone decarboxylase
MKFRVCVAAGSVAAAIASACIRADDRLPPIPREKRSDAQQKAAQQFAGQGEAIAGPFVPLLRSPELMVAAKAMGDYLRSKSVLPPRIAELAILVVCREWTQQHEWQVHYPLALKAGLRREAVDAIAEGRRPSNLAEDEQAAYDFSTEILRNKSVSDSTYRRALAVFGEQGVVELLGVSGYYGLLATVMNGARTALPLETNTLLLRRFPD